ncbi:MAG: DUF559 domain-containing protein [Chitinophagales bacterium]|nr:DUF559 domain-containing protein [Bacteroidota bacterium]MBP8917125.1 DUF559 domain-containing protein [Chitinophagales bacterium]MBP9221696.1 DUF559 domain-containing protein [Chitinophagales bacterium]MBP9795522.1 DUF559 domain-containing protein [Chitinophagales bacterium]
MALNNYYNKNLKKFSQQNRKNSTKSEDVLWVHVLSSRKMMEYKFLRQRPIDIYIADFFCKDLKLIIEADGITHQAEGSFERDEKRTKRLNELGYTVIRFSDQEILGDTIKVMRSISEWIEIQEKNNPELLTIKKRKIKRQPKEK